MTSVGKNIRRIRKEKRLSQSELAERVGAGKTQMCEWELGNHTPKYDALIRIAVALSVSLDTLLGVDTTPKDQTTTPNDHLTTGGRIMITLNDLLTIVDARQLRVIVPVTPRLKARITVNTRQTAELDDIIRLYGEWPIFSAEPAHEGNVMEIELTTSDRPDLGLTKEGVSGE